MSQAKVAPKPTPTPIQINKSAAASNTALQKKFGVTKVGPYGHSSPFRDRGRPKIENEEASLPKQYLQNIRQSGTTPLWERDAIAVEKPKPKNNNKALGDKLHKNFTLIRWILMATGQYPFYHVQIDGIWKIGWFNSRWNMIWFKMVAIGSIISFILIVISILDIMTKGRYHPKSLSAGQILAQALLERHTQFMIHVVSYLFLTSYFSCVMIYRKKLWLKVLNGIWHFTWETGLDFSKRNRREILPFCAIFSVIILSLIVVSTALPSPQSRGCPTLYVYLFLHNFLSREETILNPDYPNSSTYYILTTIGSVLILCTIILAYAPLILYFWSMSVIKSAWSSWNQRMHFHVCRGEENSSDAERTTYELMYWDVNRLLDITCDMDELWSIVYESYLFLLTLLLCFENGFTIKVAVEGHSPLHQDDWGKRFIRPHDYRSSMVIAPLNFVCLGLLYFCACWATDEAGAGYDIMRRKAFLDGLNTSTQVHFTTGLIQMYSVQRKVGFEFGRYVEVSRSNFLILCNLVISTSILVYQLNMQNDMLTLNWPFAFETVSKFVMKLEGLQRDHATLVFQNREEQNSVDA